MARLALAVVAGLLMGCSGIKISPPYTPEELEQRCESRSGRWHDDEPRGGFCEYPSMA